jgi:aspartyl/asparaginyl-tRNA synthetase
MNKKKAIELISDYLMNDEANHFYETYEIKEEALEALNDFLNDKGFSHIYLPTLYVSLNGSKRKMEKEINSNY